jgi:hypothetical protein
MTDRHHPKRRRDPNQIANKSRGADLSRRSLQIGPQPLQQWGKPLIYPHVRIGFQRWDFSS